MSDCRCQYEGACCCKMPQYVGDYPCPCLAAREAEVERLKARLEAVERVARINRSDLKAEIVRFVTLCEENTVTLAALKAENVAMRERVQAVADQFRWQCDTEAATHAPGSCVVCLLDRGLADALKG